MLSHQGELFLDCWLLSSESRTGSPGAYFKKTQSQLVVSERSEIFCQFLRSCQIGCTRLMLIGAALTYSNYRETDAQKTGNRTIFESSLHEVFSNCTKFYKIKEATNANEIHAFSVPKLLKNAG